MKSTKQSEAPSKGKALPAEMSAKERTEHRRDIVPPAETSLSPRGGAKHRTLKKEIVAALAKAGPDGLTLDEISKKLDVLKARIQSWFSGTGKRTPEVEKVAPGRWRHK